MLPQPYHAQNMVKVRRNRSELCVSCCVEAPDSCLLRRIKLMNETDATRSAISRVEQTKHLIREAGRTRLDSRCPTLEEIDRTRRLNAAMANLVRLIEIDGMENPAD
jgi:hypothetical protein